MNTAVPLCRGWLSRNTYVNVLARPSNNTNMNIYYCITIGIFWFCEVPTTDRVDAYE
jgi:hypothetical protein